MKQDELWDSHYQEIMDFITTQKRRPSKHRLEEHQMLNWMKYCKKQIAQGKLSTDRVEKFNVLMSLADKFQRKNQYEYARKTDIILSLWDDEELLKPSKKPFYG